MNPFWLNIRILLWHIQIPYGSLVRASCGYNRHFGQNLDLVWRKPVEVYECDLNGAVLSLEDV